MTEYVGNSLWSRTAQKKALAVAMGVDEDDIEIRTRPQGVKDVADHAAAMTGNGGPV